MISMRWEVAGRAWQSAAKMPARRGPGGSQGAPRRALRPPRSPQTAKGDSWSPFFECARCAGSRGGAGGSRTPDLLNAIQALSQLSYSPDGSRKLSPGSWTVKSVSRRVAQRVRQRAGFAQPRWWQLRLMVCSPARPPEWRNWHTQGTQNAPVLAALWVRIPPPAPLSGSSLSSSWTRSPGSVDTRRRARE